MDLKFNPSNWNPLPKKKFLGYKKYYDFSWILDKVMNWNDEIKKKISVDLVDRLPLGITYYNDLDKSTVFTHLGETIEDMSEFTKQRREFIEYVVKIIKDAN